MNEGQEIRFIDLFSGIGGFRLGLERASSPQSHVIPYESKYQTEDSASRQGVDSGWDRIKASSNNFRCVWSCDNNKYANQVYAKHFGEANHYTGDIRDVDPRTIPDHDILCAGFPCQAFSISGKRKGFEDTRGTLFFEICRIAEIKRPQILLLENVRGLLSNDKGATFGIILQSLSELGYLLEWQVLNSKHFGVPQNRQRVFLIGHLGGTGGREIFPVTEAGEYFAEAQEEARGEGARLRDECDSVSRSLRVGGSGIEENLIQVGTLGKDGQASRVYSPEGTSPTLPTPGGGRHIPKIAFPEVLSLGDGRPNRSCLRSGRTTELSIDGMRIRRLTPVECERLQSFPDGWTEFGHERGSVVDSEPIYGWQEVETEPDGDVEKRWVKIGEKPIEPLEDTVRISDTQRYKMLGNAVTTNVISFLGKRIMEAWIGG